MTKKSNLLKVVGASAAIILMGQGCFAPQPPVEPVDDAPEAMMEETMSVDEKEMMMDEDVLMEDDKMMVIVPPETMEGEEKMMEMTVYDREGILADVTGGNATGVVRTSVHDGTMRLFATFENLPEPEGTDFYEGWIVRRGADMSVISTGVVEKVDGVYINDYTTGQVLHDHDFYVLTIEPDDGDPAPAGHVLEGVISFR